MMVERKRSEMGAIVAVTDGAVIAPADNLNGNLLKRREESGAMVRNRKRNKVWFVVVAVLFGVLSFSTITFAVSQPSSCDTLPSHDALQAALQTVVAADQGECAVNMSARVVNRNGVLCAAAFSASNTAGDDMIAQAFRRTLENGSYSASGAPTDDQIALAFRRTLGDETDFLNRSRSVDPVATAFRRTLENPLGSEARSRTLTVEKLNVDAASTRPDIGWSIMDRDRDDPVAMAYSRTLGDARYWAYRDQSPDPILMAYRRTLEQPRDVPDRGPAPDQIAMAFRRTLADTQDRSPQQPSDNPILWRKFEQIALIEDGVALYVNDGILVGALGVQGDTSCRNQWVASEMGKLLGLKTDTAGQAHLRHSLTENSVTH